jgi:hypothetical protein
LRRIISALTAFEGQRGSPATRQDVLPRSIRLSDTPIFSSFPMEYPMEISADFDIYTFEEKYRNGIAPLGVSSPAKRADGNAPV